MKGEFLFQSSAVIFGDMPVGYEELIAGRARSIARLATGHDARVITQPTELNGEELLLLSNPWVGRLPEGVHVHGASIPHADFSDKTIFYRHIGNHGRMTQSMAEAVGDRGLNVPGYSCFSLLEVAEAADLLRRKTDELRLISPNGTDSKGQLRVDPMMDIREQAVTLTDEQSIATDGIVVCEQIPEPVGMSVGRERVNGTYLTTIATQETTINHLGQTVYGGSKIQVIAGYVDQIDPARVAVGDGTLGQNELLLRHARMMFDVADTFGFNGRLVFDYLNYRFPTDFSGRMSGTSLGQIEVMREVLETGHDALVEVVLDYAEPGALFELEDLQVFQDRTDIFPAVADPRLKIYTRRLNV